MKVCSPSSAWTARVAAFFARISTDLGSAQKNANATAAYKNTQKNVWICFFMRYAKYCLSLFMKNAGGFMGMPFEFTNAWIV